jgi:glutathione synthase/RimK-type ligase-like ATP-grasp enzyme
MAHAHLALVTARAAQSLDEDLIPLQQSLAEVGVRAAIVNWDDAEVDWSAFDLVLLRSTWDYSFRLGEFRAWAERVAATTRLLNPLTVILWNTDKHYLQQLETAGVPIVPSLFVEPGEDAAMAIRRFLAQHHLDELVVKPAIGSGAREVQRHPRSELDAIRAHVERLTTTGRSVFLQPYLDQVHDHGETALVYFGGRFSHAIRKGPLLRAGQGPTQELFAREEITPRIASAAELEVGARALAVCPGETLLYARVDLIRDETGQPCVLELEVAEPSLFLTHAPGAAQRFAREIIKVCSAARSAASGTP